MVGEHLGLPGG